MFDVLFCEFHRYGCLRRTSSDSDVMFDVHFCKFHMYGCSVRASCDPDVVFDVLFCKFHTYGRLSRMCFCIRLLLRHFCKCTDEGTLCSDARLAKCLLEGKGAGINTFTHASVEPLMEHIAGQFITLLSTVASEEAHGLLLNSTDKCSLLYALFSSANMHCSRFRLVYRFLGACRGCEVSKTSEKALVKKLFHNMHIVVGPCL